MFITLFDLLFIIIDIVVNPKRLIVIYKKIKNMFVFLVIV